MKMRLGRNFFRVLGHRLKHEREKQGLSQLDIALELRTRIRDVHSYEAGTKLLSIPKYIAVCKFLEVKPGKIFVESIGDWIKK